MTPWPQPLDPLHSINLSALAAALPMILLLILMGVLRKSGFVAAAWGLLAAGGLAVAVWRMPPGLALRSTAYGLVYGLWPIMWIVFAALWLYNLSVDTGKFDLLRLWMAEHASGDARIQVILVAFCFGALLEGTAGFGAPVAVAAFLLLGLGFSAREAATVCLVANTAPVAFGGLGIPIVALAAVTGLDLAKLSSMAGRQVPFLSLVLPSYLVWMVARRKGVSETWPAAVVTGASFALTQFLVSNFWGPYAADIVAALAAIVALTLLLRVWKPPATLLPRSGAQRADAAFKQSGQAARENPLTTAEALAAWAPWILLSAVMVAWAYLNNYSGMAYTLGAALAALGWLFPLVSGYLGWMACFLSGSDTASNLLFGNLQVAAAHQLGLNPILLAATNSSGAVTGKMISPQDIAVGVTTVGLIGREGEVLRTTFWHSILLASGLSALAFAQAYWLKWMVP